MDLRQLYKLASEAKETKEVFVDGTYNGLKLVRFLEECTPETIMRLIVAYNEALQEIKNIEMELTVLENLGNS